MVSYLVWRRTPQQHHPPFKLLQVLRLLLTFVFRSSSKVCIASRGFRLVSHPPTSRESGAMAVRQLISFLLLRGTSVPAIHLTSYLLENLVIQPVRSVWLNLANLSKL